LAIRDPTGERATDACGRLRVNKPVLDRSFGPMLVDEARRSKRANQSDRQPRDPVKPCDQQFGCLADVGSGDEVLESGRSQKVTALALKNLESGAVHTALQVCEVARVTVEPDAPPGPDVNGTGWAAH
jgi:hypothetical protein